MFKICTYLKAIDRNTLIIGIGTRPSLFLCYLKVIDINLIINPVSLLPYYSFTINLVIKTFFPPKNISLLFVLINQLIGMV